MKEKASLLDLIYLYNYIIGDQKKIEKKIINEIYYLSLNNPEKLNAKGQTLPPPLIYACQANENIDNLKIIETLLKKGCNVNIRDSLGYTALYHCCIRTSNNSEAILKRIKLLLKNGADPNIIYSIPRGYWENISITEYCNSANLTNVLIIILKKADGKIKYKLIKLLIKYGLDTSIYMQDHSLSPESPTIIHAISDILPDILDSDFPYDIIRSLINAGADINIPNFEGNTVLHLYLLECRNMLKPDEYTEIFKILFEYFRNINLRNRRGNTLLTVFLTHFPIVDHYSEIFDLLIENGSRVDIIDRDGNSIIHNLILRLSAYSNFDREFFLKIIDSIINKGFNANILDNNGDTPLSFFLHRLLFCSMVANNFEIMLIKLLASHTDLNITMKRSGVSLNYILKNNPYVQIAQTQFEEKQKKYEKKIEELEKRINILERENENLQYVPGNVGYIETMADFNKLINTKRGKK